MEISLRERLLRLSTTNISDAMDSLGINGTTCGIVPIHPGCKKIAGEAVTLRLIPQGLTPSGTHLGIRAIESAGPGDVIVVDNAGRPGLSCWGGILATGASLKGVSGVVIDGACRDVDDYMELGFSVYARSTVVATARGRVMEENTNIPISFGGVQVCPGDVVLADHSGVVVIPSSRLGQVLALAEALFQKEEAMCADLRAGMSSLEVDRKYHYESMLKS
ncbi:RraA family protein [Enterocloster asparagiformis]|uniref:RraA family protein n=1 Tax=Enterocloster asparagiformis TaxID=333367 RepID=UPI002A805CDF|nr:RraA family protein [Enterocloster asparagiformis]